MRTRVLLVVGTLVLTGLLHGRWADRWGASADVTAAVERLSAVPQVFGEWEGRDITREESEVAARSTSPLIVRRYVHRPTGATVGVLVTCGRPGGMVTEHTPQECYKQLGYAEAVEGKRHPVGPPDAGGEGFVHTFAKTSPVGTHRIRLVWAWGEGRQWSFPEHPRVAFAKAPYLYKLYVTRELLSDDEPLAGDPTLAFLEAALPALTDALNPSTPQAP